MYDSHCHLHDPRVADPAAHIARARAVGVRGFLLAGVSPDGWRDEERLASLFPEVAIAFGVHPQWIADLDDAAADQAVAALDPALDRRRPSAIGEIGLDGVGDRRASLPRQERAFRAQLATARERDLPVVLHVLRTHGEALRVLRSDGIPSRGGVVHSYSGSAELCTDYLALGLHLSFAGPVSYANARRTLDAVRRTPRERLLVETDAPDQTPEPHRPSQNQPAFLPAVIDAVARARDEPAEEVARYTEENARRLFGLEGAAQ